MSAQREKEHLNCIVSRSSHLPVLVAGGPPAVPVKSLRGQAHVATFFYLLPLTASSFFRPPLLSLRRFYGRLDLFYFLGRWKHGRHSQRFDPKFARPAGCVIEVLVFFVLNLIMC